MAIIKKETDEHGNMWGYDDASGWVPLDEQTEQGSFVGNVIRGAGRGFEDIAQGAQELVSDDPATLRQGEDLRARQEQAGRGAPWAEFLGGMVPAVTAGTAAGVATGGASLPAQLAGQAIAGGGIEALRPGGIEERLQRAVVGAGFGLGGGALGHVAASGIARGLMVGEGIANRSVTRIGREIDSGMERVTAAQRVAGEGAGGAPDGAPGGRSVGAAQTPEGELGDEFAAQNRVLQRDEDIGANIDSVYEKASRKEAENLGYRSPLGAGSRSMSPSRMLAAGIESTPLGDQYGAMVKASNQRLTSQTLAKALDMPSPEARTSIQLPDLADAEAVIGQQFEQVQRGLPAIDSGDVAKAFSGISQKHGAVGKMRGQKLIDDARENAEAHGGMYDGDEIMQTREALNAEMSDFYAQGKTRDGEAVREAIDKLDNLINRRLRGSQNPELAESWARARTKWQILTMAKRPGAINPQGDINPLTLLNQMRKNPSSGGFGTKGPERGTPEWELWTLLRAGAADNTGVPMTGARLGMKVGGTIAQGVGLGMGGAGLGLGIFGN